MLLVLYTIIFQMDGKGANDTSELEKFSVYEPRIWKRFEETGNVDELRTLNLFVPERYQEAYAKALKEYVKELHKDGDPTDDFDDPIRETRKETGTIRTY